MSSSFLGARLHVQLQGGYSIEGTISRIDTSSGSLHMQREDGLVTVIPRQDISDLKILPPLQPPQQQQQQQAPRAQPVAGPSTSHIVPQQSAQCHLADPAILQHAAPSPKPAQRSPAVTSAALSYATADSRVGSSKKTAKTKLKGGATSKAAPSQQPRVQTPQPEAGSKSNRQRKKEAQAAAATTAAATASGENDDAESDLGQDFDFDKALKSFDKKKIWQEIKTSDTTDPKSLLVSHNRKMQQANGGDADGYRSGQEKLAWNQPVLSPSPPPTAVSSNSANVALNSSTPATGARSIPLPPNDEPLEMHGLQGELDNLRTTSFQRDLEMSKLHDEVRRLRSRAVVLEALAGVDLVEDTQTSSDGSQAWRVTLYESVAAHTESRRAKQQQFQNGHGAIAQPAKGALTFVLSIEQTSAPQKQANATPTLKKLRYLGADPKRTDPAVLARLPAQYKGQMGLKSESASIFFGRVKSALQESAS